ncbi:hypothetical protein IW261DRAFT_1514186 [Armillaria novae-zelandiae]|uniref:Uncharacterized protein n=1 Tax=Armillaria novae-zelandiae TaxID=153914 RepID=A0AA39NSI1_9AGAR|nr:hypothetical protein IW261DRAFT_1514186 [Armillaria novae-zelandiae]
MSVVLPQEIADKIVDLVYGRYLPNFRKEWQPELFACSLVCKTWTPRTRYYLFKEIDVVSMNQPAFMHLISNPTLCTFAPYIHSVCIEDSLMPPAKVDWVIREVLPALSMFPNIESMYIANGNGFFLTKSEEEWEALLKSVSSLTNVLDLRLEECQFRTYNHFASLLSSFRTLETVILDRCEIFKFDPEFCSTIIPSPSLHTITFIARAGHRVRSLFSWLRKHSISLSLFSTKTYTPLRNDSLALSQLLRTAGTSIKTVSITLPRFPMEIKDLDEFSRIVDLSKNRNLTVLNVDFMDSKPCTRNETAKQVAQILSTVTSQKIEKITIDVPVRSVGDLGTWDGSLIYGTGNYTRYKRFEHTELEDVFKERVIEKMTSKLKHLETLIKIRVYTT